MPGPWLAQAGAQVGTSALNFLFGRRMQEKEFAANRAQSQLAYQNDLDMWNRQSTWNRKMWDVQNEYNLPANQMQRLRDAGLNPNLAAGGGSAGGQATSIQRAEMPKYQAARANYQAVPLAMPDMIGLYNQIKATNAQVDQAKAQKDLLIQKGLTESVLRSSRLKGAAAVADRQFTLAQYANAMLGLDVDIKKQRINSMMADRDYKRAMIPGTQAKGKLAQEELNLWLKSGMRMQDAMPYRIMMNIWDSLGIDPSKLSRMFIGKSNPFYRGN